MRVVVTGGTGFVGSAVVCELARQGHEVVATYRSEPDPLLREYFEPVSSSLRLVECDVTDRAELVQVFSSIRPAAVVHAAVLSSLRVEAEKEQPYEILNVNLAGTVNTLLAAAAAGAHRAVYLSSSSVFPPGSIDDPPILEEDTTHPASLYGITKLSSELVWSRLGQLHGVSTASVRIAQPYGPMERATGSRPITSPIHEWVVAARRGRALRVPTWRAGKDWTYVGDTARGIAALVTASSLPHDLYHLGWGRIWLVEDVVRELRTFHPRLELEPISNPTEANPNIAGYGLKGALAVDRIATDIGFKCEVDLAQGLRAYHNWLGSGLASETVAAGRTADA